MTRNNYKIPFRKETGHMLGWASGSSPYVDWKDNYEFEDTLIIRKSIRGTSSTKFIFEGSDGKNYEVFVKDMVDMFNHSIKGKIHGMFTFCKRGENYGLKLLYPIFTD